MGRPKAHSNAVKRDGRAAWTHRVCCRGQGGWHYGTIAGARRCPARLRYHALPAATQDSLPPTIVLSLRACVVLHHSHSNPQPRSQSVSTRCTLHADSARSTPVQPAQAPARVHLQRVSVEVRQLYRAASRPVRCPGIAARQRRDCEVRPAKPP